MYFVFDEFEFDGARLELRRNGTPLKVQRVALQLLAALLRQPGALVTKDTLVADVWQGRAVADNAITVAVNRLRRALAGHSGSRTYVATVYGVGYRFARPVTRGNQLAPATAEVDAGTDTPSPFVGRRALLVELRQAALEASGGRGRVCVVMGEPGAGKSRLVRVLTDEIAADDSVVAWGLCREAGTTPPLAPWLQLARSLVQTARFPDSYPALRAIAAQLGELLRGAERTGGGAQHAVPLDASSPVLSAVARAFLSAAEATPLVLVLEDLHRADAASLEVLSLLVDEIGHARVLVLATLRESLTGRHHHHHDDAPALSYVVGHSNTARLAVKRLGEDDVREYVATSLDDADEKLGRAVYAKSQGNPFFMVELVRQLRRDEVRDEAELRLPDAVLDAVRQHVATLDPRTRELLAAASVLGMSFELTLLREVTGRSAGDLAILLDRAVAADVLIADRHYPTAFAFAHELVRAALYEAIPLEERRRRHLQTAHALELQAEAAHRAIAPSELADHFYAALPHTDLDKTVHYCDAAARAAAVAVAYVDAARHLKHALDALALMPAPPPERHTDLLMRLAVFSRGSEPQVLLRCIREVTALARARGDVATVLRAAMLFHVYPDVPALPGASEALEHALAMIPAEQNGRRACALAVLATAPPRAFSRERAQAAMREVDALLVRGNVLPVHEKVVLLAKLFAEGGPGGEARHAAVVEQLDRIWARAPKREPVLPLFLALNRAVRANQRGQGSANNSAVVAGLATAREIRHRPLLWFFERFDAIAKINAGACESGRLRLEALHRQAARRPTLGSALFAAFDRAVVLPEVGADAPAHDGLCDELRPQPWDTPGMWAMKVRALAAAGLHDEASAGLLRLSPEQLAELPLDSQYPGTLGLLARAVLQLDAREHAAVLVRLMAPVDGYFASHSSYYCEGAVAQLRGMLMRMLGREREAYDLLQQGLRLCERAGFVRAAIDARIALAECVLALGGTSARRSARQLVSTARALAEQHGLPRSEARAATLARELGAVGPSDARSRNVARR